MKKNGNGHADDTCRSSGEFSDQIGYRTVDVGGSVRLEPINPRRQAVFEAAVARLRQV
jgi:hypothetical protein